MIATVSPPTLWNLRTGRLASAMSTALALGAFGGCGGSGKEVAEMRRDPAVPQAQAQAGRPIAIETAPAVVPIPSADAGAEDALFTALERMERRVAGAMARVRESVVALEYTAADSPTGARRVATGVVISPQGEVLSIRIDRPPSSIASGGGIAPASPVFPAPESPASKVGKGTRGTRSRPGRAVSSPIVARDSAGRRYSASWVAADPETGLTLLRIAPRAVRPIRVATDPPKLGSSVFVVGNPFGLGHSVSRGHVAGLDRALELGNRQLGGLTQVQVPLYPGDSGATVANLRGEWLGLIRGGLAASAPTPAPPGARGRDDDPERDADHDHDIGFAITARDAIWIADQLRTTGRVDRAYLGVRLETPEVAEAEAATEAEGGPEREGARLSEILADSPAASAGLRIGDRIVALDDHPIRTTADLTDRLDRTRANTEIILGVLRADGSGSPPGRIDVALRAASRPGPSPLDAGPGPGPGPAGPVLGAGASGPAGLAADVPRAVISRTSATSSSDDPPGRGIDASSTNVPLRPATVAAPAATAADPPARPTAPAPAQRPLPLESQAAPPRPADLEPISPRAVIERLERIERRIERIERRESNPTSRPTNAP